MRLTEQKPLVVAMEKQDFKKYWMHPHVSIMENICDLVLKCVHMAARDSQLAYDQPFTVCRCAFQSEGHYSYQLISGYIFILTMI
jgi:hypothetical protein